MRSYHYLLYQLFFSFLDPQVSPFVLQQGYSYPFMTNTTVSRAYTIVYAKKRIEKATNNG
jgi:hypothetical protein